jgi:hypothetical protein
LRRAILIDPKLRSITGCTLDGSLDSLCAAIGSGIEFGTELDTGDVLYVDDVGRLTDSPSFFALIGTRQAFAGRGLLVGAERYGSLTDVTSTVDEIARLVTFDIEGSLKRPRQLRSVESDSMADALVHIRRRRIRIIGGGRK